ncbi:ATP-binding cassette sub-family A member 3-like, partial [Brachionus plicatilis]
RERLEIANVGISVTTIEDVFLKIGEQEHEEEIDINDLKMRQAVNSLKPPSLNGDVENIPNLNNNDEYENFGLWAGSENYDLVKGISLFAQQFYALIIKRIIHSLRNKALISTQIVIPVCCLLINLFYLKYAPIKPEDSPALEITLNRYQHNFVPVKFNISSLNENFDQVSKLAEIYKEYVDTFKSASSFYLENNSSASECPYQRNNIDEYIGCLGRLSLSYIVDDNLVATEFTVNHFNDISIIGHFNNQPFHVPPLALSLITSSMLTLYSNESSRITVINHPLPRNLKDKLNDMQLKDVAGFNISTGLTFGLSFLIASFAMFLIKEKANDSKHVQYLSGCNSYIFWTSAFLWDLFNYFVSVALVPIFLKIFGIEEFMGGNRWIYVIGLLVLYGFSHIPQMYLFSYFFRIPATGFAALVVWNIMSSQATLTPTQILTLPQLELVDVSKLLEWIFLVIFPNFTFGQGMIDLYNNYQITKICKQFVDLCPYVPNPCCYPYVTNDPNKCGNGTDCFMWTENYMSWEKPGLLRFFVFMPIQFFVIFGLILIYEAGYFRYFKYILSSLFSKKSFEVQNEEQLELEREYGDIKKDEDVIKEETRISENLINPMEEIFVVDGITKYYSNFMAVK